MLLSSARAVPAILVSPASFADSCTSPFATATSPPAGAWIFSVPFGPLTVIASDCTWHSTPFGSAMGFFATRDIVVSSLRHEPDDLAAETRLAGLRVGHDAGRRGHDGDAETTEDLRQRVLAAIHAKARAA